MAIYLVGSAVPGSAAWGSGKGASMEQGNLPQTRALPHLPPSWQTPVSPVGSQGLCATRVPALPPPLSLPRCKAQHWDGQSSPAARGTSGCLGLGTPAQVGGPAQHLPAGGPSPPPAAAPSVASGVPGRCLSSKTRGWCPPASASVCGSSTVQPWGCPGSIWTCTGQTHGEGSPAGDLFTSLSRVPGQAAAVA